MVRLSTAWAIFQGLLVEALPFLLIGVAISGIARWLVPQAAWIRRIPRNPVLAPIIGALLRFALPAFLSPGVTQLLVDQFGIKGIPSTVAWGK